MIFTTTATIRPEILEKTYFSFSRNIIDLKLKNCKLYLNIDKIPDSSKLDNCINVARKYFKDVSYNVTDTPNFCNAVKWCWSQPSESLFFHLEDDWELRSKINFRHLIRLLDQSSYVMVNLRSYNDINDGRLCLSPCLVKTDWAKHVASKLNVKYNPEKQIREISKEKSIQYPNSKIIFDLGRDWIKTSGYIRGRGKNFTTWIKQ